MRIFNFFLLFVLIVMLAFGGYCWLGSKLSARAHAVTASASDYPDVFSSVQSIIASGTAYQTFSESVPETASGLTLCDVTISLSNNGLLKAEWLDIQLVGVAGDVAVYSLTGQGADLAGKSSAQVNLKLISRAPANTARTVVISYYVFGIQRSVEVEF